MAIEVRRSRVPCARSPAWHGRGSGILLHHETRIGHTGHPHAGARHAVHLPRARRRAGGGSRAARLGGLRRAGAVRAPAGGGFRGGARRGGSRSFGKAGRGRRGSAARSALRLRRPIRGCRPARAPLACRHRPGQAQAHRARAVQAVLRRGRRRMRPVALRALPGAALFVRAPVHAAGRRAAHGARARGLLAAGGTGRGRGGRPLGGARPGVRLLRAAQERRQAGVHRGGLARGRGCAWRG